MQLTSLFPPTQAFSYLGSKPVISAKKRFFRHGITILSLLFIAGTFLYVPFPKSWFQSYLTQNPFLLYPPLILFLGLKAFFVIEAGGYLIHRYFEHLGFMTRRFAFVREGQRFHWAHHMIIYPLNKQYIKGHHYVDSVGQKTAWHWLIPLFIVALISFYVMGWKIESFIFVSFLIGYARLNELVHARFHIFDHPWEKSKYFQFLADIHVLHHFDQETNFTITIPLMDLLFGTYFSPQGDFQKVKAFMKNNELNSSDFINWHYLLTEATPVEYAKHIAAVQKYPGVLKKAQGMLNLLEQFQPTDFYYEQAQMMKQELHRFLENIPPHSLEEEKNFSR